MIATYDMTGWIVVALGFATVIAAVAGDHFFTRRMERREQALRSAGVNTPRLSNTPGNKTARGGSEGREQPEGAAAVVSTGGPDLLPPTGKNSKTRAPVTPGSKPTGRKEAA